MKRCENRDGKRMVGRWISFCMVLCLMFGMMGCKGAYTGEGTDSGTGVPAVANGSSKEDAAISTGASTGNTGSAESNGSGEKVMGRYTESMNGDLADYISSGSRIVRQEDGSLVIFSPDSGKWVSKDGGADWEPEPLAWFSRLKAENAYIMDIAVSMDGNVGIIYCERENRETGRASDGEESEGIDKAAKGEDEDAVRAEAERESGDKAKAADGGESENKAEAADGGGSEDKAEAAGEGGNEDKAEAAGEGKSEDKAEAASEGKSEDKAEAAAEGKNEDAANGADEEKSESTAKAAAENENAGERIVESGAENGSAGDYELHPKYMVFCPDGESVEFEISYVKGGWLHNISFSDDGKIYGAALDGKIYEVDWKQGSQKTVAQLGELMYRLEVWGGRIVCSGSSGIMVLDLDTGDKVADPALDEFLDKQMGEKMGYAEVGAQPLVVLPAGDDILYLICEKGIYRHVLGGTVVEQLADGTLNSLGNPTFRLSGGILLEGDEFLLLFTNGQIGDYAYDPDMPAVPDVMLRVYSLTENRKLKAAIASFQAKHPEAYVRYDIGMDGSTSAAREDALKKLNTEIAAGNGPDLFILDDMPMDSYMEKGILADLSPFLEKTGDEYFQNILRAFEKGGKILAVPTEFQLPVAGGKKEDVGQMKDLHSIAGLVRKYREEKPEGSILGLVREKDMIKQFLWVCAPAWTGEGGSVDEGRLEEFFTQIKEVWDAEEEGITDKMREEAEDFYLRMEQQGRTEEELEQYRINNIGWSGDQYMVGKQEFFLGGVDSSATMDMMISYFHVEERKDGDFASYGGQASNVFIPGTVTGISQASQYQEMAAELLEALLEESYWTGLSLKKEQLWEDLRANATEDGSSYASAGGGERADGSYIYYDIYPASEEEAERLVQITGQAETPYMRNRVLEKAVCEAGEKVLKGELGAREAVQEVKNRVALYMAE